MIVAGAGIALWRVLATESEPKVGPDEVSVADLPPAPPPRPELPSDRILEEKPRPPREALYVSGEEFPRVGGGAANPRHLYIPSMAETGKVGGAKVREALLAVPDLYLRWQSEEVKQAFLHAELRLRPDVAQDAAEGRPAGAPIRPALDLLPQSGFRAWLRPPVVQIFTADAPNPDSAPPR